MMLTQTIVTIDPSVYIQNIYNFIFLKCKSIFYVGSYFYILSFIVAIVVVFS